MTSSEFLKKVRTRAGLHDDEEARCVTDVVLAALRIRISHDGGDNMAEQLPREIKDLWESGLAEHIARGLVGVDRMDLSQFFSRIQNGAHLSNVDEAEDVARAVFSTLREQISHGSRQAIGLQLPEDIREFWASSAAPEERVSPPAGAYGSEEIGPSAVSVQRSDEQLAEEVEDLLESSDELDSEKIDVHVMQGMVTLRGVVRSSHQWEHAQKIASEALGVTNVRNELTIVEEA